MLKIIGCCTRDVFPSNLYQQVLTKKQILSITQYTTAQQRQPLKCP